jgi:hypothetical protein
MTESERAYIERTERERQERFAKARAEGCPPGWEEEWQHSAKLKMMVWERAERR